MHKTWYAFTHIHKTWGADTDGVASVQLSEICLDFTLSQADCLMPLTTCFCPSYRSAFLSHCISPSFSPPSCVFPFPFNQREAGPRRERSSVPLQGVMGQVTWPAFTPTTAACQAVRTRTGSPRRVSLFQMLQRWKISSEHQKENDNKGRSDIDVNRRVWLR